MKTRLLALPLLTFTAVPAIAGDTDPGDAKAASAVTYPAASSPWRIGAGYAQLLGLKTRFTGLGKFNSPFAVKPLGGGVNYDYDNGFVHVDSSGNAGGMTWNWGYQNNSQYRPAGPGTIYYSLTNSVADGGVGEQGGADPGVELFGYYDMGAIGYSPFKEHNASWGFRGGFHYSHVNAANNDAVATGLVTTNDHFDLGGAIPPLAPYAGSFGGPGPLLGDSPRRDFVGGTGVVSGNRELDVDLTIVNFGTFLEVPVTKQFNVLVEAGVSVGIGSGSYDYQSTTSVTGLAPQQSAGHDSSTNLLPGVYLGLSGIYELTKQWSIQCAGRYQYMDSYDLESNGSKASLSFGSAFVVSLGGIYSF